MLQYIQDNDEKFPQTDVFYNNAWSYGSTWTTPPKWRVSTDAAYDARGQFWASSIQPYVKSYAVYTCPSTQEYRNTGVTAAYTNPPQQWADMSYAMNGDLGAYNNSGIQSPASLILFTDFTGKSNTAGFANQFPTLVCDDPNSPCVYQAANNGVCATGNGATDAWYVPVIPWTGSQFSAFVHGPGDNLGYADGHVKWVHHDGNGNVDPWAAYDATGVPTTYYYDNCHDWLYRPEYVH